MAAPPEYYLENWSFATPENDRLCRDTDPYWECIPPSVCAYDDATSRGFCCDSNKPGQACWTDPGTQTDDALECTSSDGEHTWYCIIGREVCDETGNGNCKSTSTNPLKWVDPGELEKLYSELLSESASASFLSFDPFPMMTRTASATSTSTGSDSTETSGSRGGGIYSSGPGLSGGAIAGIVVGGVGGIALLIGVWYLLSKKWRGKTQSTAELQGSEVQKGSHGNPAELAGGDRAPLEGMPRYK